MPLPTPLDEKQLRRAVKTLAARDADLAAIVARFGQPPLWPREPGFATLVHIILEQQVSLASAKAAFDRLQAALNRIEPASFLTLDDAALKAIGFSRQKMHYVRSLAGALLEGELDLHSLHKLDDAAVRAALKRLKGIGDWTVDVYLLMALRRPDAWPVGDLGLLVAAQEVKQLPARPSPADLETLGEAWRPWRAVAARLLWHHYLSTRRPALLG
jgi:DNA-3-methyladenine glycosylase II